jgi:hypothetical protein
MAYGVLSVVRGVLVVGVMKTLKRMVDVGGI